MKISEINKKMASLLSHFNNPFLFKSIIDLANIDMVVNNTTPLIFLIINNKKLNIHLPSQKIFSLLEKCQLQNSKVHHSPIQVLLQNNKKSEIYLSNAQIMSLLDKCDLQIPLNVKRYNLLSQILFLILSNNQKERLYFSEQQILNLLKKTNLEIEFQPSGLKSSKDQHNILSILLYHMKEHEIDFTKEQFFSLFENISDVYLQKSFYEFFHHEKFFYQDTYCQKIIHTMLDKLQLSNIQDEFSTIFKVSKLINMDSQELFIHLQHLSLNQQLQSSTLSSKTRKI